MRICQGCGGVLGRDCFNERECIWIGNSQDAQAYQEASFVPQLESQINDLEIQFHLASNRIETLTSENDRLRKSLLRLFVSTGKVSLKYTKGRIHNEVLDSYEEAKILLSELNRG